MENSHALYDQPIIDQIAPIEFTNGTFCHLQAQIRSAYGVRIIRKLNFIGAGYYFNEDTIKIGPAFWPSLCGQHTTFKVVAHELAHHLQFLANGYAQRNFPRLETLLDYELQAERVAYHICISNFAKVGNPWMPEEFDSYRNHADVTFLHFHYGLMRK